MNSMDGEEFNIGDLIYFHVSNNDQNPRRPRYVGLITKMRMHQPSDGYSSEEIEYLVLWGFRGELIMATNWEQSDNFILIGRVDSIQSLDPIVEVMRDGEILQGW